MTLHPARSLCWLDFLDENEKFGYFILIIITYKQTEFPVTLLSWSFEISVLAGFCTAALTILGSSLHIWFWKRGCTPLNFHSFKLTHFQPVTTTKISDWITVIIAKITSLASRVWYNIACSTPQEPDWSKGPREVNWWVEPNFGFHNTFKLPETRNGQNMLVITWVPPTRKEYIGHDAAPCS